MLLGSSLPSQGVDADGPAPSTLAVAGSPAGHLPGQPWRTPRRRGRDGPGATFAFLPPALAVECRDPGGPRASRATHLLALLTAPGRRSPGRIGARGASRGTSPALTQVVGGVRSVVRVPSINKYNPAGPRLAHLPCHLRLLQRGAAHVGRRVDQAKEAVLARLRPQTGRCPHEGLSLAAIQLPRGPKNLAFCAVNPRG